MKRTMMIPGGLLALGLSIFGYANAVASPGTGTTRLTAEANQQTRTFSIEKMTCPVCPITVTKAIKKVAGVKTVEIDFDAKTATVLFDPAVTSTDEIAKASTNAGYPASLSEQG